MNVSVQNKSLFRYWLGLEAWQRIMIGLVAGVVVGFILGPYASYLKPLGSLFINAIHMMIAPVVFTASVCAIISINDPQKMQRIGVKTILLYMVCMAIAATIGLSVATFIAPGTGLHLSVIGAHAAEGTPQNLPGFTDLFINMVPANPVAAFVDGNILQILVFAVVIGISINMAGAKAAPVVDFFHGLSSVVFKLAALVMSFAPYGIFGLIACVAGKFGWEGLIPLMKLTGTIYLCFALHILIVYMGSLTFIARLNPINFLKGITHALIFAFSSTSGAATLPVTIRCAEENLGVSPGIARFLLPIGTSLNMNGLSIYLGAAAVFAANVYGVHLDFMQCVTVVLTIVLTCMGAGGVPGSAIIVMSAVLSSVGLPIGVVALIAGIDRILDMGSTTTNVMGDVYSAVMIAKSEKELDHAKYNAKQTGTQPGFAATGSALEGNA